jgi:four helix bundle protein
VEERAGLREEVLRDHSKLQAFGLADQLALDIYSATRTFPDEERFGLTSQLRRCAVSIAANIVEGCARPGVAEYRRFLSIAYASAKELQYELSLADRLGYLERECADTLQNQSMRTAKALWGLIESQRLRERSSR